MGNNYESLYENLKPALAELEAKRLELKNRGTHTGLIAGGICCFIGFIITLWAGFAWTGIIISLVISIIILIYCIHSQSAELSAFYKKNIIAVIISNLCKNSSYEPENGIAMPMFMSSNLFDTTPDRYHSEDLIAGKIDKTVFLCSEIIAEERRVSVDNKGNRHEHWVDIFKGFFFMADFQKDFKGQTVVYRNSWFKLRSGKQRVKLESPDFEKSFEVYSTDQVEARYLLSPNMMEKLLELDRKFPGKITASFCHSSVIVVIPDTKNHFEASIWHSATDRDHIQQEFQTLSTLFGIIDDLHLNLRIWSKE